MLVTNRSVFLNLFLLTAYSLGWANVPVRSGVQTTPDSIWLGDRFTARYWVDAPESAKVDLPGLVGNLGSFEVLGMSTGTQPVSSRESMPIDSNFAKQNLVRHFWELSLSTFLSGTWTLPSQPIEIALAGDTIRLQTDPLTVEVQGRLGGDETDILDVEDPLSDGTWPWWAWTLLGLGIAGILVALALWLIPRFKRMRTPPPLPPYEEAIERIRALRARELIENADQATFFTELGLIVRRYLHRRYGLEVLDATVAELRRRLGETSSLPQAQRLTRQQREDLLTFAQETEGVKFAQEAISAERCTYWDQRCEAIVHETRPQPEEQQPAPKKKRRRKS